MKKLFAFAFMLFFSLKNLPAQSPEILNASDILLRMKKLAVLGSVLYVAAHPDDENTRLLAWLSQEELYRTGYLSLTRGDGGQNLIGDEQGVELGLIRTQELLAARRVDGAEQFFARAYDFGFSKSTEEALKIWDEQKMLSDLVWVIRKFQPDIIITRFPEDKRAGHGQHSASAVLARMAFRAAADPKQFPEQFNYGVHTWQAVRLFWNTYRFGSFNTTSDDNLKIEVGNYNALLGKSYGEIAADSRSQHRSQGFGATHTRGNQLEYFALTAGEKTDSGLMQNIDCSWNRISGGPEVGKKINRLLHEYNPAAPDKSLRSLVDIYKAIKNLPDNYWKAVKMKEVVNLIRACSGLWIEATVDAGYAVLNETIPVTIRAINRAPVSVLVKSVSLNNQDSAWNQELQTGVNYSLVRHVSLKGLPVSQPYWLVEPMSAGSYNVKDQTMIGNPANPPTLEAVFQISLFGEWLTLKQPVLYQYTDAVKGELFEPLTIVPAFMAYADPDLIVFNQNNTKDLHIRRQSRTGINQTATTTDSLSGSRAAKIGSAPMISLTGMPGFENQTVSDSVSDWTFSVKSVTNKNVHAGTWVMERKDNGVDTVQQCRTINYEHIPRIDYFKPAYATMVSVNLLTRGSRIGYIEGAGDKVPDALNAMGYTVVKLNENAINQSVLQNLDAVIAGVRAYDVHDWLTEKYAVLMDYVRNGGNLIVQYNRNLGSDSTGIGPFPFGISNLRVTEEDAAVKFLQPANPVLHFPNEITENDFEGWIQERGIYFATHVDPGYQQIFSMHDTGEPDLNGSLIVGPYGKGYFTYTGLVFFRELPAGVPGAYRLLANLIALNKQK